MSSTRTLVAITAALAVWGASARVDAQTVQDYRLRPTSPAVNSGLTDAVYATFQGLYGRSIAVDLLGTPRGPAFDIGALELLAGSDLRVTLADSPDPVAHGAPITYTMTVFNDGPLASASYSATLALPSGSTFGSAPPACSPSGLSVTCTGTNLAVGANASFVITATAPPPGTATATATVTETSPLTAH